MLPELQLAYFSLVLCALTFVFLVRQFVQYDKLLFSISSYSYVLTKHMFVSSNFQADLFKTGCDLHQKIKNIPACLATETIEQPLFAVASEGRGLFFMKRTAGFVGFTRAFKARNVLPDKFYNVQSVLNLFCEVIIHGAACFRLKLKANKAIVRYLRKGLLPVVFL